MKKTIDKIHFLINLLGIGMSFAAGIIYFAEEYERQFRWMFSSGELDGLSLGEKLSTYCAIFLITLFPRGLILVFYFVSTILLICVLWIFRKQPASVSSMIIIVVLLLAMGATSFAFSAAFSYMTVSNMAFFVVGLIQTCGAVAKTACYIIEKKLS